MTNYDYYILCEDDYLFIKDNFDTILIEEYKKYNTDYHVLWRTCKMCGEDINYNGKFKKEGICTIGIISKAKSDLIKNFNDKMDEFIRQESTRRKMNPSKHALKCHAMRIFLLQFNSISYTRNTLFPCYAFKNDSISIYIDDDLQNNSILNPENYKKLINILQNKNDSSSFQTPILACYQFVKKVYPHLLET